MLAPSGKGAHIRRERRYSHEGVMKRTDDHSVSSDSVNDALRRANTALEQGDLVSAAAWCELAAVFAEKAQLAPLSPARDTKRVFG